MRPKNKINFVKLLNYNLSYNPIYEKLFVKTAKILDNHIGEPLSQLARIRSSTHIKRGDYLEVEHENNIHSLKVANVRTIEIDGEIVSEITLGLGNGTALVVHKKALQDRKTLINSTAMAGVDYYSDFITDREYARIIDYAGSYWKNQTSGKSSDFVDFIGFIKDMRLTLIPLWTKDQGDNATSDDPEHNFYEYLVPEENVINPVQIDSDGNLIGGTEYLTSHVDLEYDVLASPEPDFNDLINLFYYFAPIHLVLYRVVGDIYADVETHAQQIAHKNVFSMGGYKWTPNSSINLHAYHGPTYYDVFLNSYMFLDSDFEQISPTYGS